MNQKQSLYPFQHTQHMCKFITPTDLDEELLVTGLKAPHK